RYLAELTVAEQTIEGACRSVAFAQLETDDEGTRGECGFLEPLQQSAGHAAPAMGGRDSEQVEVRDIVPVAHDRKAHSRGSEPRREHHAVGIAHVPADARRSP